MKLWRPRSSATRLALLYVAICALCIGGLVGAGYLITQRALEREVDLVIATELDALRDEYDAGGITRLTEALNRRTNSWGRTGAVYLLADEATNRIAGNLSEWPPEQPDQAPWLQFDILARERGQDVDHPVRAEIRDFGRYRLLVGTDISQWRRISERLRATTLWGVALSTLLAALIGWWYSRRVGARVREVAHTCETIISGELMRRLPLDGSKDEFDELAVAVNHVLDRIEHQTEAVRATFHSAAHDLRGPLHRMRVRLEAATHHGVWSEPARETVRDTLEDLERVQRTLATLLQIAQADASAAPATEERVDMSGLVHELVELYAPEARERGLALTARDSPAALIRGNRQLLAQLLVNLIENAIKFVPNGGHIQIDVDTQEQYVRLRVRDDGPGIPQEFRLLVLRPFQRLERDESAHGSGLGLSLVAAVVRLHRGVLTLADNQPGLDVCCEFSAI